MEKLELIESIFAFLLFAIEPCLRGNSDDVRVRRNVIVRTFSNCTVASWLVCSSPESAVLVRALAGDTVLCSCTRHLTLTVFFIKEHNWVPANCYGKLTNSGDRGTCDGPASRPGGVEILLAAFMLQKPG